MSEFDLRRSQIAALMNVPPLRIELEQITASDTQFAMFKVDLAMKQRVVAGEALIWKSRGGLQRLYDGSDLKATDTLQIAFSDERGLYIDDTPRYRYCAALLERLREWWQWVYWAGRQGDDWFPTYRQRKQMQRLCHEFTKQIPIDLAFQLQAQRQVMSGIWERAQNAAVISLGWPSTLADEPHDVKAAAVPEGVEAFMNIEEVRIVQEALWQLTKSLPAYPSPMEVSVGAEVVDGLI